MMRINQAAGRVLRWSACAAVALAANSAVRAADEEVKADFTDGLSLRPVYMVNEPAGDGLLQTQMRERGWGGSWLEQNDIKLTGYAEAGYTYNFARPPNGANGANGGIGRLFDDKSDDLRLDQLSIMLKRDALVSADRFDTGFGLQVIYGADARYTQANGTNFYGSGYASRRQVVTVPGFTVPFLDEASFPGQPDPENQIDILQVYGEFNLPVGNGLVLTAGKFVTPWGIEHIDPTQNYLYSHSYIFALSTPRTLTGVTAKYQINEQFAVTGGIVAGWDQTIIEDNNDFPSLMAQVEYKYAEDLLLVVSTMVGPEQPGDTGDLRWLVDGTVEWQLDADVTIAGEVVMGYEPDIGTGVGPGQRLADGAGFFGRQLNGEDCFWFGGAIYLNNRFDADGIWTLNARAEYFNDNDGAFLLANEVWAASIGMNIVPFAKDEIGKNLMIRPEIRYDYSKEKLWDGNQQNNQITLGADVIFKF
ncbi:MAG: porin [Anaerolineae bacterium]|nr:porin [Phycisphaerae bacterium]